jgi:hypothetical protein
MIVLMLCFPKQQKGQCRGAHLSSKTLQEAANAGSVIMPGVETKAA